MDEHPHYNRFELNRHPPALLFTNLARDDQDHLCDFRPLELCTAVLLALATHRWRQQEYSPRRLSETLKLLRVQLRRDPWFQQLAATSSIEFNDLLLRAQISFWAFALGLPIEHVCGWWEAPAFQSLSHAMGQQGVYYPQRIAEFHQRLGVAGRTLTRIYVSATGGFCLSDEVWIFAMVIA